MKVILEVNEFFPGDWECYDDLTYDVDHDGEGYVVTVPVGVGHSPFNAIREWLDQVTEEFNEATETKGEEARWTDHIGTTRSYQIRPKA